MDFDNLTFFLKGKGWNDPFQIFSIDKELFDNEKRRNESQEKLILHQMYFF